MSGRRGGGGGDHRPAATNSNGTIHRNGSVTNTRNNIPLSTNVIRYMECQRNQAIVVGGFAVDGCREFMATGEDGTPEALICAACNCHRSFHRRVEFYQVVEISTSSAAGNSQQNGY